MSSILKFTRTDFLLWLDIKKRLSLPDSAGPVESLKFGEQVLISDFSRDRIYRFDLSENF